LRDPPAVLRDPPAVLRDPVLSRKTWAWCSIPKARAQLRPAGLSPAASAARGPAAVRTP